jgi:hypothetical protein
MMISAPAAPISAIPRFFNHSANPQQKSELARRADLERNWNRAPWSDLTTEAAGAQAWDSVPDPHSRAPVAGKCIESKLTALIMFSWHQILQANDAAAAAVAISAATG